ncbi:beta-glucosidase [Sphingobacterium shayense]|uniref:GH1 family beta-glucosidase n=1 Tax=Sphingobacterium shayense TaxID=626343 RepID=UPI001554E35D|nr:GH1 family beta-glucosidase [Sphingobacterium shayense]NQD72041.1 beta-glucosidase [Sphingobacterium shayense]
MLITKDSFGEDFMWGVSTAAYQIEGAHEKDSKGASIWDVFAKKKNKIFANHHGDVACDFYHRFVDDLELMASLNIREYRFSISWSRIFPQGDGEINEKGVDFYNRVIDLSLELGITPWITLYHWDLPQGLELKGGWINRDIVSWFERFVQVCVTRFGDRVTNWMVLNEPVVFTGAGYFFGVHAPGRKGLENFLAATHHAALAQASGARVIKQTLPGSRVGTTFSCSHIEPYRLLARDINAAKRADALLNRLFIEPLLGMGYPIKDLPILKRIERYMKEDDERNLSFDMDFIGLQNYTREIIRYSLFVPYLRAKIVNASKRKVEMTAMNWEVYPESMYHILKRYSTYKNIPPLIITESGAAFEDFVIDGKVDDRKRQIYLQKTIEQVLRAKQEGVDVRGYFVWTFLDNFEWAEGYRPRFGLIHVDFESQKRTIKSSGYWYSQFLK